MSDVELIEVKTILSTPRGHVSPSHVYPEVVAVPAISRPAIPTRKVILDDTYVAETTNPFGGAMLAVNANEIRDYFGWVDYWDCDPNGFMEVRPMGLGFGGQQTIPQLFLTKPGWYLCQARIALDRTVANYKDDGTKLIQELALNIESPHGQNLGGGFFEETELCNGNSSGGSLLIDESSLGAGDNYGTSVQTTWLGHLTQAQIKSSPFNNSIICNPVISAGGGNYPNWTFVPDPGSTYIQVSFLGLSVEEFSHMQRGSEVG